MESLARGALRRANHRRKASTRNADARRRASTPGEGPRYVVDFFAHSLKLAVEVDGTAHDGRSSEDAARDAEIARLYDVRVVRFAAGRVENDLTAVLRELAAVTG